MGGIGETMKYLIKVQGYYYELSEAQGKHLTHWKKGYGDKDDMGQRLPDYKLDFRYTTVVDAGGNICFDEIENGE